MVDLVLCHWSHAEHTTFAVMSIGKQDMILEFLWLWEHKPEIDWTTEELSKSWCPQHCVMCAEEVKKEWCTTMWKHTAIRACCIGHLPFADLDLLDPLPLVFSHREALYKDNRHSKGDPSQEEGYKGEFLPT